MLGIEAMFQLHCSPDLSEPPSAEALTRLRDAALRTLVRHPVGGVVDAVLTDDAEVRRLNQAYRGRDSATDVLSFSLQEPVGRAPEAGVVVPDPDIAPTGEVYISVERATEQARDLGVSLDEELARLLVHGLLHLAGYDHQTEAELLFMERETETLLDAGRA